MAARDTGTYVCMHACMYACMHVYMHTLTHTHNRTQTGSFDHKIRCYGVGTPSEFAEHTKRHATAQSTSIPHNEDPINTFPEYTRKDSESQSASPHRSQNNGFPGNLTSDSDSGERHQNGGQMLQGDSRRFCSTSCASVCMFAQELQGVYVCMCMCVCVCVCACVRAFMSVKLCGVFVRRLARLFVCLRRSCKVCVCVYMYVCDL